MIRLRMIIGSAVAAVASGCAPSVALRNPEITLPPAYEREAAAPSAAAAELDRWWLAFRDPQLTILVDRALQQSSDARLARARVLEARAIRRAAAARFRLQGDLTGNLSAQGSETVSGGGKDVAEAPEPRRGEAVASVPGTIVAGTVGMNVSYELDLFGRREATRVGADADLLAARFAAEASRAVLVADVADTLFAARALAVQRRDAGEALADVSRLRDVLAARVSRGLAADAELARIDTDLRTLRAQALAIAGELDATRRALLALTGDADGALTTLLVTAELGDPPAPPPTLPSELLQRRPDVREAEAGVRAAGARTALARLELFPRLTLNPGGALTRNLRPDALLAATWTVAAGLSVPILDRPRLLAELDAEAARGEQAVIGYERAVQTAFAEADSALLRLAADRERVRELDEGARRAVAARTAARTLYARGLQDVTTLLDAERAERAAREALSIARSDTLRRTVTAFRALGGGWTLTDFEDASR